MVRTLINWLVSAIILWLLSFVLAITFSSWVTIVIVAVVLGLLNALIVPAVKGIFKAKKPWLIFVISLVVDAAALWLVGIVVPGFSIAFFPTALIAAAVLAIVTTVFGATEK